MKVWAVVSHTDSIPHGPVESSRSASTIVLAGRERWELRHHCKSARIHSSTLQHYSTEAPIPLSRLCSVLTLQNGEALFN